MTEFIHIEQGYGGFLTSPVPSTTPPLTRFGTHSCRTCVCVYIPISTDRCFIAHIDAHVAINCGEAGWMPTPAQGQTLKDFTKKMLTERVPELANGDYSARSGRTGAIVVCPCRVLPLHGDNVPATGRYVVEAINEFFNLKHEGNDAVTRAAHGFVVDQNSGYVQFLEYAGASGEELTRWYQLLNKRDDGDLTEDEWREARYLEPRILEKKVKEYGYLEKDCGLPWEWCFWLANDGEWMVGRVDRNGHLTRNRETPE